MLKDILAHANGCREPRLADLCDWLRIPSVSTLPEHAPDVRRAAEWAAARLNEMGFPTVELVETAGHPLVFAQYTCPRPASTLLIYGHFDVQPVDPLEEWLSPPFEPRLEGQSLYARGASDDKGQLFAVLMALESWLSVAGGLPLNVKLLLEGEEEISSPSLPAFLNTNRERLAADAILICDSDMLDPQAPVVMYGVRGNLKVEIEVRGPAHDLHSGTFGGSVDNPFNVLARLLASLQDGASRRVLIPGFYDTVAELGAEESLLISRLPISDDLGRAITSAPALGGEAGYSLAERISVRPTLDIHGIMGGFTGAGSKTVIPARATAKLSMRLVPDQAPQEIFNALESYLKSLAPPTVQLTLRQVGGCWPVKIDYHAEAVQAAARALRAGFGAEPFYLRGGGSLPILHELIAALSPPGKTIPAALIGFGLPDDHTHAPNEKIHLPNFYRGIETIIHYLSML